MMTRRGFLKGTAAGLVGTAVASKGLAADAGGAVPRIRLSACDWSLGAGGPGGLEVAKRCTLDGLEVSPGGPADRLQIADPAWRAKLKEAAAKTGVAVSSVAMGLLNECPLASDPRGPAWLEQVIEATADLGARAILLAFFGPGDLLEGTELKAKEADVVVGRLKDAAPNAKQAGVILGVESYLSAAQNLDLLKRIGSDSVRVYYDVRNSTDKGYDVPAEIRTLGDRICQVHFKDGEHYLGEGKVDMDGVAASMAAIGYQGWVVLETSCPSKDRDADFTRNAAYARKLLKIPAK
jgi:sugar phosphate isomerase/epimerase